MFFDSLSMNKFWRIIVALLAAVAVFASCLPEKNKQTESLAFCYGVGPSFVADHPYEDPAVLLDDAALSSPVWVQAFDETLTCPLTNGEYFLDPDNNDPSSTALYEAEILPVDESMDAVRIKFNSRGYAGIGLRYQDKTDQTVSSKRLYFYTYTALVLRQGWGAFYPVEDNESITVTVGKRLYLEFYNPFRDRIEPIHPEYLKITGGDASVASLDYIEDGERLFLSGVQVGTTSWTIGYDYLGMTVEPITIHVNVSDEVPVESITITNPVSAISVGQSFTCYVSIAPSNASDQEVTWSSTRSSVAVIASSNGNSAVIKGVGQGRTAIMATCGGHSDNFVLTVR